MSNVIRVDSNYKIQVIGGGTITLDTGNSGTVVVTGNLDVKGTNTAITSNFAVEDNVLLINYGEDGNQISEGVGGLEISRGTNSDGNAFIIFDESISWNDPISNTVKNGLFVFKTDYGGINGIRTNSIDTNGGDLFLINQGTGKISVSGTDDYENQVTDDDDIPNKKYVDDTIAESLAFGQVTGIASGNTYIQVFDDSAYVGVSKAVVTINNVEIANYQENQIDFFNLRFSGTKIETTLSNSDIIFSVSGNGSIILQADSEISGDLAITGNTTASGDLAITGNTTASGNLSVIGTTTVDDISVLGNATISGDLSVVGNYYITGISVVDNVEITGNTIQNTVTNNDLNLSTVGTGVVRVQSSLTVDNNLVVTGNLTVNGSTTTVNSTTLTVDDKNIELASTASPTDTLADGGGIVLKASSDKTILYNNSNGRWETNIGLTVGGTLSVTPSNSSVTLSPTGSGTVTINPATAGSINNMNIGASTRGTGAFTTLAANSTVNIDTTTNSQSYTTTGAGTITISSGTAGNIDNMNIGATTAGTGAFTTLSASSTVSGTGFSTYLASPPAIGGTAANTATFTQLTVNGNNLNTIISPTGTGTVTISPAGALTINPASASTINNTSIGASTRASGAFTTLAANSTVNIDTTTNSQSYTTTGAGVITITSGTTGNIDNMNIGATTRGTGAFTTLAANGNVTLGDADTDTITVGASFVTGTVLRSAKSNTNTLALAAYDVDGAAYSNLITLTASNTPTLALTSTGIGSIDNMNVGASTRGTGAFTTLAANSTVNIDTTTNSQSYTTTGAGTITISSGTVGSINNIAIGGTTPAAGTFTVLTANGSTNNASLIFSSTALSSTAWTTSGIGLRIPARTYTDTNSIAGTVAASYIHAIAAQTFASTNAITITEAASLFVAAPVAGTNSTLTGNGFSIVAGGRVKASDFTGTIGATTASAGTFTSLTASGAIAVNTTTNNQSYTTTGAGTITITSGTVGGINNMNIGASTRGTGAFTTLAANSTVNIDTTTNSQSYTTTGAGTITITSGTAGNIDNMNIGASTRGTGAFTTLAANGNVTLGDADTDTITVGASFVTGTVLRSAKSNTNTLALAAYDVDGAAYTNLITLTASNTPTLALTSTGVGTIDNINVGATTAGTGRFTTLQTTDTSTPTFDLTIASTSSTALTADRTLTFDVINAARTIKLAGNIDLASSLTTSGAFALTLTTTASTNVTLPTSGTLYGTATGSITSSQLATSVSDETGSGSLVFATSPTLTTPNIGAATGTSLAVTGAVTSSSPSAGIGYATGAGSTVTQLTSRTTAVTINALSGAITLFNATTSAGGIASFTVNNNTVSADDVIIVNFKSNASANSYNIAVTAVAAGSFRIQLHTLANVNPAEAPVISFAVIKAVTS